MSQWHETRLDDVLELQRGFDITKREQRSGAIPVVSSSGVNSFHDTAKCEGPGVVIGRKGSLGTVYFIDTPYWPHDTTLWVRDFKGNDPAFCSLLLRTLSLKELDAGASNPTLNRNHAHLLRVRIPDVTSQLKISAVLFAIDELAESNRQRVELLNKVAQSIFLEWFVHFRFPGVSAEFVGGASGGVPDGWAWDVLRALASVNPSATNPSAWETVRYLDISAVGERLLSWPAAIPGSEAPGRARRLVADGDIVHAMVRPNRRAHGLVVDPPAGAVASTGLAVIRPLAGATAYLYEMISSYAFTDFLVGRATGAAYPAVKPSDFEAAPVLIPSREILAAFETTVGPLHRLAASLVASNEILETLRTSLIPKLVTGQIDVESLGVDDVFGWSERTASAAT